MNRPKRARIGVAAAAATIATAAIAVAGAAVAGVSASASAAGGAAAGAAAASAEARSKPPVLVACGGKGVVTPVPRFTMACADANDRLGLLHWTSWGPEHAFGTGTRILNNCVPNCAKGRFTRYPVIVVLFAPRARPGYKGSRYFTEMTTIFIAHRPPRTDIRHLSPTGP